MRKRHKGHWQQKKKEKEKKEEEEEAKTTYQPTPQFFVVVVVHCNWTQRLGVEVGWGWGGVVVVVVVGLNSTKGASSKNEVNSIVGDAVVVKYTDQL